MKLIIATPSPYARKARVALMEKGITFETIVDNPWLREAQAPGHNPLGKIPILVLDDGRVLHDSKVIVEYVDTLGAAPRLIPIESWPRIEHKQMEALADGICDAVVLTVLEHARPMPAQSADWLARQRAKIMAGVAQCERAIAGREWLIGERFGLADICTGCMLGYLDLRLPAFEWRELSPQLAAYYERIAARASFRATQPSAQTLPALG